MFLQLFVELIIVYSTELKYNEVFDTNKRLFIQYSGLKCVNFCWFTPLYCRPSKNKKKDEFMDKHFSAVLLQLHSVTPSFQTSRACSSWIFQAAFPSSSASRAEERHYLLRRFPLPIFSSCHCWEYINISNKLLWQLHSSVYVLNNTHLLMLTTPVFPALFSTWSHSSSSPWILYLRTHKSWQIH